ncbi:MAG TPA: DUF2948 family protein [Beijerinckiaceae bacterium]|nr:DUF2948 family protein [Beijerinckiaceae bacterium]
MSDREDVATGVRPLRLLAVDGEDLDVISAHLQDALVRLGEMAYFPSAQRFALVADRFDWCAAAAGRMERCRAGLHFDRVLRVRRSGFAQEDPGALLNLLSIAFEPSDPPAGSIYLTFSGGGALRLEVECVEAQMRDIGPRWATRRKPGHAVDDEAGPR